MSVRPATSWPQRLARARAAKRPLVMGVLNVTPDSFSDGGRYLATEAAIVHALAMIAAGADIIDVGGESTRPGAAPLEADEEAARVVPVIAALAEAAPDTLVSIDTMKVAVARAAVEAGAGMWNDVTALGFESHSLSAAAELEVPVALMHMQGEPRTMQANPTYDDVVAEVIAFLNARARAAEAAGVAPENILVDPGIGFGKTLKHNLALIAATGRIAKETGKPVLFGASRKRFIKAVDSRAQSADDRLGGSLAAALAAARLGAAVVRVHDVAETAQALDVQAAIAAEEDQGAGG
ncbi:MAG: dihydropteroate synthase [Maricaulaceae bacterium]|jgi:dihydropteroate synthase